MPLVFILDRNGIRPGQLAKDICTNFTAPCIIFRALLYSSHVSGSVFMMNNCIKKFNIYYTRLSLVWWPGRVATWSLLRGQRYRLRDSLLLQPSNCTYPWCLCKPSQSHDIHVYCKARPASVDRECLPAACKLRTL